MKTKIPFLLILFFSFSNCMTNVEDLTDDVTPEPEFVSYANDIQPIFNARCTSCHGSSGGISFSNYSNTTSGSGRNYGSSLIVAGDADASGLINKLGPNPQFGSRMPQGGSLTNQEIATIRAWINEGAQDN